MSSFVTGGTGFIGRHLVELLLARGDRVHVLVRESSLERLEVLRHRWGAAPDRVVPVVGDLSKPLLGVEPDDLESLRGNVSGFFHVAALYDMAASRVSLETANVQGTWHAVQLAHAIRAGRFHHVSSIAAAGTYRGSFREDMFEEATGLDDPYFRTKHASEGVVRSKCRVPWRIYRPGIVVGHSQTGEMDKVDGPYYVFPLLQRLGAALPAGLPLVGIDGGPVQIVPVDFVARAMDHIAHQKGLDGQTFHLVDPSPLSVAETLNAFARVAGAPEFAVHFDVQLPTWIPDFARRAVTSLPLRVAGNFLDSRFGVPSRIATSGMPQAEFDCANTTAALRGTDIRVPPLDDYAERLWAYWEEYLDADPRYHPALAQMVAGKRVLVTGASSGIGRAAAIKLGAAGAEVLLVARSAERLEHTKAAIGRAGGIARVLLADLSSPESCDLLAKRVLDEYGGVDVLVNNAGHSIRRSLVLEYERFHDYERTMQLNYFGALKLILAFLPGMRERGDGQIVNVSSVGVQTSGPQFSAYLASKAALDAFSRSATGELLGDGVTITTVYMPLVKTQMTAPTPLWDLASSLTASQAAELICYAIVQRPTRVSGPLGLLAEVAHLAAPRSVDTLMNVMYRLFPDSQAARGQRSGQVSGDAATSGLDAQESDQLRRVRA